VRRRRARAADAFTMIEIALSILVVAVALVAIVGILPSGYQVQKDNREDTIILQDANFLLDAVRSGARGLVELSNYVETITISNRLGAPAVYSNLRSNQIVGLLSTPKVLLTQRGLVTNRVTAHMRAISGSAVEKPPAGALDVAFRYQLTSEVIPFQAVPPVQEFLSNTNEQNRLAALRSNLHEVRFIFRWPLLGSSNLGPNRRVFRTTVNGALESTNDAALGRRLYYFHPATASL
jgi:type II secretory pathway pseudopilin PulG